MRYIDCATQAELDEALTEAGAVPCCAGDGWFEAWDSSHVVALDSSHVEARGSSHVEAWDSSHVEARGSSHVEARDSSHVEAWDSSHVEAWGSSHVEARDSSHVEAWDSSHVEAWGSSHVEARDSSHVAAWGSSHVEARDSSHVEAWGSSHVEARDSSHVAAGSCVAVTKQREHKGRITGGVVIKVPAISTAAAWCAFYGASVSRGIATLYKAVDDQYCSGRSFAYAPGSTPQAPDWDGGKAECGGGLHFCAHPSEALRFFGAATRFVACPVRLKDIVVHRNASYPTKVKAHGCCGPVYEVDRYGERLEPGKAKGKTR